MLKLAQLYFEMPTSFRKFFWLFVLLWASEYTVAQNKKQKYPEFGYHTVKNKRMVRFPFRFISNLIIVPVQINNSDTLNFVLDTGVSNVIITDPSLADKYGLVRTRHVKVSGAGTGEALTAFISTGNQIYMGGVRAKNQNLVVLEQDFLEISQTLGIKVHGLIGYDIFNYFVVNIDFLTSNIFLYLPERYKYKASRGEFFPLDIVDTKPYLNDVEIEIEGKKMYARMMIDTGAGHAVSIELGENDALKLPKKLIESQLGKGLNGPIFGHLGRADKVVIGKFTLNDVLASYPDSVSLRSKLPTTIDRNGNLGCDILKRFSVTFNYRDKYLQLKPSYARLREPFEHNMSGIEFLAKGENLDQIYISKVEPNSPGDLAGFKEGDQLISINNKNFKEETLANIYKMFQVKEGRQITLLVKRGNQAFFNSFTLKRLI